MKKPPTINLRDQVFDCLPAGRYALAGLLRMLDVVVTDEVDTAAVECRAQPRLLINPDFVAKHAETPEKLMMLVLHEVHHVLLGHTRRFPSHTKADNFIFDCVINALLCRMFPQPEYTAIFRDFYPDDVFPACFLRPPEGWNPKSDDIPVPPALRARKRGMPAAREVYQALYSRKGVGYQELWRLMSALSPKGTLDSLTLLGDHVRSVHGEASASGSAFAQAAGEIVSRWPSPPDPLSGQSLASMLRASRVLPQRASGSRALLRGLIRKVAGAGQSQGRVPRMTETSIEIESPIPQQARRAMVTRSLGGTPLLYRSEVDSRQRLPVEERVQLYVDVSGSMDGIKGALYGAVLDCADVILPRICLFSTATVDVTPAQLRAGFCKSTGGTSIDCVVEHMHKYRVRRAVILTDGFVGEATGEVAERLAVVKLGVAYTEVHHTQHLARFTRASAVLPINT